MVNWEEVRITLDLTLKTTIKQLNNTYNSTCSNNNNNNNNKYNNNSKLSMVSNITTAILKALDLVTHLHNISNTINSSSKEQME